MGCDIGPRESRGGAVGPVDSRRVEPAGSPWNGLPSARERVPGCNGEMLSNRSRGGPPVPGAWAQAGARRPASGDPGIGPDRGRLGRPVWERGGCCTVRVAR
ncbi:hypothetical protein JCM13210_10370 [Thermaerobacter litoralis]